MLGRWDPLSSLPYWIYKNSFPALSSYCVHAENFRFKDNGLDSSRRKSVWMTPRGTVIEWQKEWLFNAKIGSLIAQLTRINWLLRRQPQMAFESASINFPFRGINLINFPFPPAHVLSYEWWNVPLLKNACKTIMHPLGWVPITLHYTTHLLLPKEHLEKHKLSPFFNYHKMRGVIK